MRFIRAARGPAAAAGEHVSACGNEVKPLALCDLPVASACVQRLSRTLAELWPPHQSLVGAVPPAARRDQIRVFHAIYLNISNIPPENQYAYEIGMHSLLSFEDLESPASNHVD